VNRKNQLFCSCGTHKWQDIDHYFIQKGWTIDNLLALTLSLIVADTAFGQQTHRESLDHSVGKRTIGHLDESVLRLNAKLTASYFRCDYGA
jgi:hypothetical protein